DWGLEHFETLTEFAKKLGIAPQNLNNYLSGKRIPGNKLKYRLENLGCDITWLMTGHTAAQRDGGMIKMFHGYLADRGEKEISKGLTEYPLVSNIYAGNGETRLTFEYESKEMLPGPIGRKYIGSLYFKVKGDSMEPKWEAGDYVLVNPNLKPKDGEYAVVGFNSNEGSIKKIFIREKKIILKSLNPDYPDEMIEKESIWFLGKVVSTLHR
ncbi:MAG: S24 family peptidase, partial [bacterium]